MDMDGPMVVVAGDDPARLSECRPQGAGVAEVEAPRLDAGDAPRLRHQDVGGVPRATYCHNDRHPAGGPQCCLGYIHPTGVLLFSSDDKRVETRGYLSYVHFCCIIIFTAFAYCILHFTAFALCVVSSHRE